MAEPFATHIDVEARWRTLTATEQAVADKLAIDASDMIRERWTDVDARIASESIAATSVTRVVAGMVKRAMDRPTPEGYETFTQGAGPFSVGGKLANPLGNLFFTAADLLVFEPDGYTRKAFVGWLA
jgi:hypothetical protein